MPRSSRRPSERGGSAFDLKAGRGWARLFLERVARAVAHAERGAALLLEAVWDRDSGTLGLLPFEATVAAEIRRLGRELPVDLREPKDPAPRHPREGRDRWFVVRAARRRILPNDDRTGIATEPEPELNRGSAKSPLTTARYPFLGDTDPTHVSRLASVGMAVQVHWISAGDGRIFRAERWRLVGAAEDLCHASLLLHEYVRRRSPDAGIPDELLDLRPSARVRRHWDLGSFRPVGDRMARPIAPEAAARAFPIPDPEEGPPERGWLRHALLLGASGAGKTSFLAATARSAILRGHSVVLFDAHGDLAPAVLDALPAPALGRIVAIDATDRSGLPPGVSVFGPAPPEARTVAISHLLAALKRLTPDGTDLYWGFRLERLFETLLRLVQEQGGELVDLWELLTDRRRREAARLATARPDDARFLEEIEAILRRSPDFLWPAAARIAKVVATPVLTALLAPPGEGLPIARLLAEGRSILWRLPIGSLGPEATAFASSLLLTRLYLELVRSGEELRRSEELRTLFVLDEAHLLPPRLLSEMVAEGRKFGLGAVLATQYPDRLVAELRHALQGAAGSVRLFRVPWPAAAKTGEWGGLSRTEAESLLPVLPTGWMLRVETDPQGGRWLEAAPPPPQAEPARWTSRVTETRAEFGAEPVPAEPRRDARTAEAILLGLVAAEAERRPVDPGRLIRWIAGMPGVPVDPAEVAVWLPRLIARGRIQAGSEGLELTPAGAEEVGLTLSTGASRESDEHRALLVQAFRLFARRGERLEIIRQGAFDTRLPDGRVRLVPAPLVGTPAGTLWPFLERRRRDWVWRLGNGRDIYVEAEVSGAMRRERLRRDVEKAQQARAFLLCLVGDPEKAAAARRHLRALAPGSRDWTVWTLSAVGANPRGDGAPPADRERHGHYCSLSK
jgi:hypothetical protein